MKFSSVCFVLSAIALIVFSRPPDYEIDILQRFYIMTGGDQWTHKDGWNDLTVDPCTSWFGVGCTDDGAHINSLSLANNNLNGEILEELAAFSQMVSIDFSHNQLHGVIPHSFWHFPKMYALSLKENELSGLLEVGYMTNLAFAHMDFNHFNGTLDNVCSCKNLKVLGLTDNRISGTIPDCLASLTQLQTLHLSGNLLNGSIPAFSADSLRALDFSRNSFTGAVSLQSLQMIVNLSEVEMYDNQLSGSISGFSAHPTLAVFDVHQNKMTGSIPEEYASMPSLMMLYGQNNGLTGFLPSAFSNVNMAFDFTGNNLYCPIPPLPATGHANCVDWTLTNVNPPRCTVGDKCYVVVNGQNFVAGEKAFCEFGSVASVPATVVSSSEIRCIVIPSGPATVQLSISVGGSTVSSNSLPFEFIQNGNVAAKRAVARRPTNADAVKVHIHGMSKCPDFGSAAQIFSDIMTKLGPDVVDLDLGFIMREYPDYPSGFWSLHGQSEVIGNALIKCVQKQVDVTTAIKYASCLAEDISRLPANGASCADRFGLSFTDLAQCAVGDTGKELLTQAMQSAQADHAVWSPTILINDQLYCLWHSTPCQAKSDGDFLRAICNAYQGTTPDACK